MIIINHYKIKFKSSERIPLCESVGAATYYEYRLLLELVVNPIIWPMKILASNNYWLSRYKMLTIYWQLSSLRNTPGQAPGRGTFWDLWPGSLTRMSGARCVGLLMVATLSSDHCRPEEGRQRESRIRSQGRQQGSRRYRRGRRKRESHRRGRAAHRRGRGRHRSPGQGHHRSQLGHHRSLREHHRSQQPHQQSRIPGGGWPGWRLQVENTV